MAEDIYPIDYTSDVGRIRKYIPDVIQAPDPKDPDGPVSFIWSDDQLKSFLADEWMEPSIAAPTQNILRAAAWAITGIASNEDLILKKITTEDLATDGPAVAKALYQAANSLLIRAQQLDNQDAESEAFFIVPVSTPDADHVLGYPGMYPGQHAWG